MDTLIQDLRYAVRSLARNPGFTAVAVLTLALGIGANTTLFSVIHAVLLRPLPYPEADRIVSVGVVPRKNGAMMAGGMAGHDEFQRWAGSTSSLEAVAAYRSISANLSGGDEPEFVTGGAISADLLRVLRVAPELGRGFSADEDRPHGASVVMLGHGLWQRRFGGDPAAIGRTIQLDGTAATVVGVLPASFDLPHRAQYWRPIALPSPEETAKNQIVFFVNIIGRLRPGTSIERARSELSTIFAHHAAERLEWLRDAAVSVVPLHERLYGAARTPLLILLGAVAFVLLIACANVANLLLSRAAARRSEFAVRTALGAGHGRLIRQVLTESLLLASIGGGAGLLLPLWGTTIFTALLPSGAVPLDGIHLDGTTLLFAFALALITGLGFGSAPALATTDASLIADLRSGGAQGGVAPRHRRLRQGLVVVELAAAVVLLIGATLLTRSLARFLAVDLGFQPAHVIVANVRLPQGAYAADGAEDAFFRQLLERARALPGVESAALTDAAPLGGFSMSRAMSVDGGVIVHDGSMDVALNAVTPSYFPTAGIELAAGRPLTEADRKGSDPVCVVNEAFARQFLPGVSALGHRVDLEVDHPIIVGVMRDVRQEALRTGAMPEVFVTADQAGHTPAQLLVRTATDDPRALFPALRQVVRQTDPRLAVSRLSTLSEDLASTLAPRRLNAILLGSFAVVALLITVIGLYAVIAYLVAQRTREIGIRMALGADGRRIARSVVGEGARIVGAGLLLGLFGALALSRTLSSFLFGVGARDPLTFIAVPVGLAAVALLACYLPARRATKIDPMVALRAE